MPIEGFEGCQLCERCGNLTEPYETLCPYCLDPALKAELHVMETTLMKDARRRIAQGEDKRAVGEELLLWDDGGVNATVESVREWEAARNVGMELLKEVYDGE